MCTQKKGGDKLSTRTGRPTDNPKNDIIKVRATKEDRDKLLFCCEKTGMTQYEVVMQGINQVYGKIKETKEIPFEMCLSQEDIEILNRCKKIFGISKPETFLYGLEILDFTTNNRDFRQLIDALVILKQIIDRKEKIEGDEYEYLLSCQLNQVKFNFKEFVKNYKK